MTRPCTLYNTVISKWLNLPGMIIPKGVSLRRNDTCHEGVNLCRNGIITPIISLLVIAGITTRFIYTGRQSCSGIDQKLKHFCTTQLDQRGESLLRNSGVNINGIEGKLSCGIYNRNFEAITA